MNKDKFEHIFRMLEELPTIGSTSENSLTDVSFCIDGILIIEGEFDKKSKIANLFGFHTKRMVWMDYVVDFSDPSNIEKITVGSPILDEHGYVVELSRSIHDI